MGEKFRSQQILIGEMIGNFMIIVVLKTWVFVFFAAVTLLAMGLAYKLKARNKFFFGSGILILTLIGSAYIYKVDYIKKAIEQGRWDLGNPVVAINSINQWLIFKIDDWTSYAPQGSNEIGAIGGYVCCFPQKKMEYLLGGNMKKVMMIILIKIKTGSSSNFWICQSPCHTMIHCMCGFLRMAKLR